MAGRSTKTLVSGGVTRGLDVFFALSALLFRNLRALLEPSQECLTYLSIVGLLSERIKNTGSVENASDDSSVYSYVHSLSIL